MNNLRKYGQSPFNVVLLHGGPGAPGSMAAVAQELGSEWGVLEPLQETGSLEGQLQELKTILEENAELPTILVGHSWGAMLAFIFSARFPALIKKIILVGSGAFTKEYAAGIMETRLNRLNANEQKEMLALLAALNDPGVPGKDALLLRFGSLCTRADCVDPISLDTGVSSCSYYVHTNVWCDAEKLRDGGLLLELGKQIHCRVTAIHGDCDPHPAAGVKTPLASLPADFEFYLLPHCGHYPWLEKQAREKFFEILKKELETNP